MHIYFFESSVPESERKKTKENGRKGRKGKMRIRTGGTKGGRKVWFPEWFFTWSIPSLFNPSSTRSFASRLLTRRSLPLTRGYRFSELATAPCTTLVRSAFENSRWSSNRAKLRNLEFPCRFYAVRMYVQSLGSSRNSVVLFFCLMKDLLKVRHGITWNNMASSIRESIFSLFIIYISISYI